MFQPRQVLRIETRWFEIVGVFLGAVGQTNLIGLRPLSESPGDAHGSRITEMFVPESMLKCAILGGAQLYGPLEEVGQNRTKANEAVPWTGRVQA